MTAGACHVVLLVALALHLGVSPLVLTVEALKVASLLQADGTLVGLLDISVLLSDAPQWIAAVASAAVLAATAGLVWCRPKADPLLVLATLSMVSTVILYHRIYDFVVLLFPLLFAVLRYRSHPGRCAAFGACTVLVFFIVRAVTFVASRAGSSGALIETVTFSVMVIAWYATLAAALWTVYKDGDSAKLD